MEVREVHYTTLLQAGVRRRHFHQRIGKWIIKFSIQIEISRKGEWVPVVRYDTAHGFAHRDTFSQDGRVEKIPLRIDHWGDALTYAENDLKVNWRTYISNFERG